MSSDQVEYWYRAEDTQYAGPADDYGDPIPNSVGPLGITIDAYKVLKHTPKGVWIEYRDTMFDLPTKKFVLKSANRRFACPTKREALESLQARRKRQAKIYLARANAAQQCADVVEYMLRNDKENFYGQASQYAWLGRDKKVTL